MQISIEIRNAFHPKIRRPIPNCYMKYFRILDDFKKHRPSSMSYVLINIFCPFIFCVDRRKVCGSVFNVYT